MINGSLYNLVKLKKTKHSTEIFLKQRDPTDRAVTHMKLFGRFLNCPRYVGFNENLILSAWIEITTCKPQTTVFYTSMNLMCCTPQGYT